MKANTRGIVSEAYFDVKNVDRRLSKGIGSSSFVLDVGCGTGIDVFLMAEKGASVVGLDLGIDYPLERAREKARVDRLDGRVDFIKAGATDLPFKDAVFDATTCFSVIDHLPTKGEAGEAIQEMRRVTRTGGDIIITVPNVLFFIGTISRWILTASRSGTFFEQRFAPNELKCMFAESGLRIQEFDSEWPSMIDQITIDNRVPPFLRGRIPIQAIFPILKIFQILERLSIFKVCGARMGFRARKQRAVYKGGSDRSTEHLEDRSIET